MPIAGTGRIYYGSDLIFEPGGGASPYTTVDSNDSPGTAASRGTTLTRPASNNTAASWTTLIASAADDIGLITLTMQTGLPFPAGFAERVTALFDVAYGAGNTVVAENILFSAYAGLWNIASVQLGVDIPAGEPIKVRYRTSNHAADIDWFATVHAYGPSSGGGSSTTYGGNTADSGGTNVDPGGSANTKGSWVELAASTAVDFNEIDLLFATADGGERGSDNLQWLIDIGVGAASSETVLVGDIPLSHNMPYPSPVHLPIFVASGTRISIRAQCNSTDPEDRVFDVVLVGNGA